MLFVSQSTAQAGQTRGRGRQHVRVTGHARAWLVALVLFAASAVPAQAASFTLIAQTGAGSAYTSLTAPDGRVNPVIADNGQVAFWAQTATLSQQIVRSDGTSSILIREALSGAPEQLGTRGLAINATGQVAYATTSGFSSGTLYVGDGNTNTVIATAPNTWSFSDLSIRADGGVVGYYSSPTSDSVRLWLPGSSTTIVDAATSPYYTFWDTDVSATGQYVSFLAQPDDPNLPLAVARVELVGGVPGPVTDVSSGLGLTNVGAQSINDSGTIAFVGFTSADSLLYTAAVGAAPTQLLSASAAGLTSIDGVSIDNAGNVLYLANSGTASAALYDTTRGRLIGVGDPLFGAQVQDLAIHPTGALNNNGQFAFWAKLSDGREVVARADLLSTGTLAVPEPGTVGCLALALLASWLGVARGRRVN
ncbi:MAG: hypothetical protein D6776_10265 [Planctomycetota bacterium]|nr:MAG: hypothetical protein D6776_10265 [Planctomycetota bacterium]